MPNSKSPLFLPTTFLTPPLAQLSNAGGFSKIQLLASPPTLNSVMCWGMNSSHGGRICPMEVALCYKSGLPLGDSQQQTPAPASLFKSPFSWIVAQVLLPWTLGKLRYPGDNKR